MNWAGHGGGREPFAHISAWETGEGAQSSRTVEEYAGALESGHRQSLATARRSQAPKGRALFSWLSSLSPFFFFLLG